jgi:hypothetical protein
MSLGYHTAPCIGGILAQLTIFNAVFCHVLCSESRQDFRP